MLSVKKENRKTVKRINSQSVKKDAARNCILGRENRDGGRRENAVHHLWRLIPPPPRHAFSSFLILTLLMTVDNNSSGGV
jgi:hypothetical protein